MTIAELLGVEWAHILRSLINSEYFSNLLRYIKGERERHTVIPKYGSDLFFKAFRTTPFSRVKVVIIGQDPYHDIGTYDGFAFSNSPEKLTVSPSLRNILKEIEDSVYDGMYINKHTHLAPWAEQGVLLLNVAHTVPVGKPGSHIEAWTPFTKYIINILQGRNDIIWMLWGKFAQQFSSLITNKSHHVISSGHPSPLNTYNPFVGCGCFVECNRELEARNKLPIKW